MSLDVIGRAERVDLPDLGLVNVPAKVDTGADNSSIWVSQVVEKQDGLYCVFFGSDSEYYTGDIVKISKDYQITRIANSFGHRELRYKVKLRIRVNRRLIRATFTLSDRSQKTYPILLGRRLLNGKFVVDVSKGTALTKDEKLKAQVLERELQQIKQAKEAA